MVQAYNLEHPRSLNWDEEVERPGFQVDSDFGVGRGVELGWHLSEARTNWFKET